MLVAALASLAIAAATTFPAREPSELDPLRSDAPIGWLADRLLNVVLFLPLGAALAASGLRTLPAVGLAAGLSASVETLQLGIPGRFPSLQDVLANATGAALGFGASRIAHQVLACGGLARAIFVAGALLPAGAFLLLPGLLLRPDLSEPPHHGQRMPRLPHLLEYGGRVESATLDDIEIPAGGRFGEADSRALAARLLGDWRLQLGGIAGELPPEPGEFVAVGDSRFREQLHVGSDGRDLVIRYWCLGTSLGLASARWRVPDALAGWRPGEPFQLRVERQGLGFRVARDDRSIQSGGFRAADGWLLLTPPVRWLERHREASGALWMAAVLLPVGVALSRWPWALAAGLVVALALGSGPAATGLLPATGLEIAGALSGIAIGTAVGCRARRLRSSPE